MRNMLLRHEGLLCLLCAGVMMFNADSISAEEKQTPNVQKLIDASMNKGCI